MTETLSKEALHVLKNQVDLVSNPTDNRWELYIRVALERPLYDEIIKALKRLEGKWKGGKIEAVIFPINLPVDKQLEQMRSTGKLPPNNPNQYFGTPMLVANTMVEMALGPADYDSSDTHILEPSAGRGGIIDALEAREYNGYLTAVEIEPYNYSILEASYEWDPDDWRLFHADFLLWCDREPIAPYNRVVMNPPFKAPGKPHAYVWHILKALDDIADNGHLISVVPDGLFTNSHKDCRMLRQVMKNNDSVRIELGVDAFKESGTRVSASIIEVRKSWTNDAWKKVVE